MRATMMLSRTPPRRRRELWSGRARRGLRREASSSFVTPQKVSIKPSLPKFQTVSLCRSRARRSRPLLPNRSNARERSESFLVDIVSRFTSLSTGGASVVAGAPVTRETTGRGHRGRSWRRCSSVPPSAPRLRRASPRCALAPALARARSRSVRTTPLRRRASRASADAAPSASPSARRSARRPCARRNPRRASSPTTRLPRRAAARRSSRYRPVPPAVATMAKNIANLARVRAFPRSWRVDSLTVRHPRLPPFHAVRTSRRARRRCHGPRAGFPLCVPAPAATHPAAFPRAGRFFAFGARTVGENPRAARVFFFFSPLFALFRNQS